MAQRRTRKRQTRNRSELEKRLMFRPWIKVTDYVIQHAVRRDKRMCVISRSVPYSLHGSTRVNVDTSVIRFTYDGYRYCFSTPPAVAKVVAAWDDGKKINPFKFQLSLPLGAVECSTESPRPRGSYKRTGKYVKQAKQRKCGVRTSRRWHGLVLPATVAEMKAAERRIVRIVG